MPQETKMGLNCLENSTIRRAFDSAIVFVWTTHLVVMYWRGTWNLLDLYILPKDSYTGSWISYWCGILLCVLINSLLPVLDKRINRQNKVIYLPVTRCCIYLLGLGTVNQWRGIWNLLDHFMDTKWESNLACFSIALVSLYALRASLCTVTPPMTNSCDMRSSLLTSQPRLRSKAADDYWNYAVDHFFSQTIIVSLVVTVWRSLWNVFNDTVFPTDFVLSNLVTWFGGLFIAAVLVALERPASILSKLVRKKHFGLQLLFEDVYTLCGICVCIAVWRGWWNILEGKLIPGKLIGGWLCHTIGFLGLVLTAMGSSLYTSTFLIDGEQERGIHWSLEYINYIIKYKYQPHQNKGKKQDSKSVRQNGDSVTAANGTTNRYIKTITL